MAQRHAVIGTAADRVGLAALGVTAEDLDSGTAFPMRQRDHGSDIWFRYLATCTGTTSFDTCSATRTFDTVIEVFSSTCGNLQSLGCNDDACGLGSSVSVPVGMGQTYWVRMGGYFGAQGQAELTVSCIISGDECLTSSVLSTAASTSSGLSGFAPQHQRPEQRHLPRAGGGLQRRGGRLRRGRALGTGLGSIVRNVRGCGPTTINSSGQPAIGGVVHTQLGGIVGVPFVGLGFVPGATPFCNCTLGHEWLSALFTSGHTLNIPLNPAFLGLQIAIQGADFLGVGGCSALQITFTDTMVVTIG